MKYLYILLLRRLNIENFWIATPLLEARNDEIKNTNFRYFIAEIIIISIACLTLAGCGGGGGGGGDNGITLTPHQQEFADIVYAFATAINERDKTRATNLIMSHVVYNKTYGHSEFKNRLENFIDKAENIHFQIDDIGVLLKTLDSNDEVAEIRADVTISYNTDSTIKETLEINVEKSSSFKGISMFRKFSDDISAFPPVLN